MNISELIFTNLAPILYNLIFILLWFFWMNFHNEKKDGLSKKLFQRYLKDSKIFYTVTVVVIISFLFLLFSYAIFNTDVDDAITSGVQAFLNGQNPYIEDVVIHKTATGEIIYGTYHYFPPDLLVYAFFYLVIGNLFLPVLDTYWFVPLHLLLIIPGYILTKKIVMWPSNRLFPLFLLILTPFLFTNSILMWFYFIIGYYLYEIQEKKDLGMVFYVLAASVKYMVGFIILFYFLDLIKKYYTEPKGIRDFYIDMRPFILGSVVLAITTIPFGLIEVIIAVFLYQGIFRDEVAQSVGPILIELLTALNLKDIFFLIAACLSIIMLIIIRKLPKYDQIMHFSFFCMLILPFYGTELFITVPFYWWFLEGKNYLTKGTSEL
ncbi:MAG: hypothetical protein EAX86_13205 [Candidatus Heimdallarchaeota archaeon]|nr:hypothetical protein [Candidatus Heimdallarchaeota archaeon]